jgi:hypothetical protein
MAISDKVLKDLPPLQRTYWTKAQEFVTKRKQDWELVEVGTDEFKAWCRYFRKQGFKPHMLTLIERKVIDKITVPAKFPEWFDSDYVDTGGLEKLEWQRGPVTAQMRAMGQAWLDRSDPVASALVDAENVPAKSAQVGDVLNYREFIAHCNANNLASRPVGAFEPGGYLGASKIDSTIKRKVFSEKEKAQFLADAKKVGEEIKTVKISDELRHILDDQAQVGQDGESYDK